MRYVKVLALLLTGILACARSPAHNLTQDTQQAATPERKLRAPTNTISVGIPGAPATDRADWEAGRGPCR